VADAEGGEPFGREPAGDRGRREEEGGDGSELARVWMGGRKTLLSRAVEGFWSREEESVEAWVSALILRKL
jgi:hypothetical protein